MQTANNAQKHSWKWSCKRSGTVKDKEHLAVGNVNATECFFLYRFMTVSECLKTVLKYSETLNSNGKFRKMSKSLGKIY